MTESISLTRQIITIFFSLCFCLFILRLSLSIIKDHQLNKSALKKRKASENFFEWFLYTKYKDVIPTFCRWLYYVELLLHVVGFLLCICLDFISQNNRIGTIIARILLFGNTANFFLIGAVLGTPKDWEEWKRKKGKQKPKK